MSFPVKTGSRGLKIVKNPYGVSIDISDRDPATRYLPPDPGELKRALKTADVVDRMPTAPRNSGRATAH